MPSHRFRNISARFISRAAPALLAVALAGPVSPVYWNNAALANDIAEPYDPLRFKSQDDMLRSFKSFGRVIREIPFDLYRCAGLLGKKLGLLSSSMWTGRLIRRNPEVTEALSTIFTHRMRSQKNFEKLCFTNNSANYMGIINADHGVCAGITTMNWLANYLAMFDESGKTFRTFHPNFKVPKGYTTASFGELIARKAREGKKAEKASMKLDPESGEYVVPAKLKLDREERLILDFYTPFIDRLFRDKRPTVFPYFTTLESFSDHPALKAYLMKHSVESWYDVNVSLTSLYEAVLAGGKNNVLNSRQVGVLHSQVDSYLKLKIQPIIFIHLEDVDGTGKSIHILRVRSARWENDGDRYVMRLVDPNFDRGEDIHKLTIDRIKSRPDRVEAVYEPYRDLQTRGQKRKRIIPLNDVEVASFFDRLSSETMASWRDWFAEEGDAILEQFRQSAANRDAAR